MNNQVKPLIVMMKVLVNSMLLRVAVMQPKVVHVPMQSTSFGAVDAEACANTAALPHHTGSSGRSLRLTF